MDTPKPSLPILYPGNCEPLKAAFHGLALGLSAVMALYNAAAWIRRRKSHLMINAIVYSAAVFWEQRRVADHINCLPSALPSDVETSAPSYDDDESAPSKAA
jgi:hypothetical protein